MSASADPYNLQRFVDGQQGVYAQVLAELRAGHKRSHWIWFIFPQIAGLGSSSTSQLYAIRSLAEARAYLQHPVLGPRLRECTQLILDIRDRAIDEILGYPDDLKFRSSMTLFAQAGPSDPLFSSALEQYFSGQPDSHTISRLA